MTQVWAVTMVKDEFDVIEGTLRHLAGEALNGIIVADNSSTDGTNSLLEKLVEEFANTDEYPELILVEDGEPAYYQSRKMTALAGHAAVRADGDLWVVPFDADELWVAPDRVGHWLREMGAAVQVVHAGLFHRFRTAVDEDDPDPFRSMVWRQREPAGLPKVAFRWQEGAVVHAGNHGVTLPGQSGILGAGLTVHHFPYRSESQFVRKAMNGAAAYKLTDLPADTGAHWRQYGTLLERGVPERGLSGVEALEEVYREHFFYLAPTESGLVYDPAPYRRWEVPGDGLTDAGVV